MDSEILSDTSLLVELVTLGAVGTDSVEGWLIRELDQSETGAKSVDSSMASVLRITPSVDVLAGCVESWKEAVEDMGSDCTGENSLEPLPRLLTEVGKAEGMALSRPVADLEKSLDLVDISG